jgi:hypothetical protein
MSVGWREYCKVPINGTVNAMDGTFILRSPLPLTASESTTSSPVETMLPGDFHMYRLEYEDASSAVPIHARVGELRSPCVHRLSDFGTPGQFTNAVLKVVWLDGTVLRVPKSMWEDLWQRNAGASRYPCVQPGMEYVVPLGRALSATIEYEDKTLPPFHVSCGEVRNLVIPRALKLVLPYRRAPTGFGKL